MVRHWYEKLKRESTVGFGSEEIAEHESIEVEVNLMLSRLAQEVLQPE